MVLNGSLAGLAEASGPVWTFAGREFDEARLELRVNGKPVELELNPSNFSFSCWTILAKSLLRISCSMPSGPA